MVWNITLHFFLANPIATVLIFQSYCFMNTALRQFFFCRSVSLQFGPSCNCVSAPQSGQARDDLLLSGNDTLQEGMPVVYLGYAEGLLEDLIIPGNHQF